MPQPKVLIFDIETAPMLAYVWGIHEQNITLNQIHSDWHILAWGAKWLGDPASKVMYMDQRNAKDFQNDKALLDALWKVLDEADVVITQNGKNFDTPRINARFIMHGMNPPSPYKHLDTYQIVRSVAQFTSNKLEYLTGKLCKKYKKLSHSKYPGFSLWTECLKGNKDAWNEMKKYNIHDVLSTEEFYLKIRAWTPENMPRIYNAEHLKQQCRTCGVEGKIQRRGKAWKNKSQIQRIQCMGCGAWDSLPIKKPKAKKLKAANKGIKNAA